MELFTEAEEYDIEDVSPYDNNPKKHPQKQIEKLKDSIREFGFTVPILITETGELIAGHGRLEAANELGMDKVPAIVRDDLDDEQVRAFRIADNRVAESGWDEDMLETELERLEKEGFEMDTLGFDQDELEFYLEDEDQRTDEDREEGRYTDKIESPVYEPNGEKPEIEELLEKEKFKKLKEKIEEADIDEDKKEFLKLTAYRHIVFDYENIAEFYAQESKEVQELMEDLTLVILDYDKAVEQGFVNFADSSLEGVGVEEE